MSTPKHKRGPFAYTCHVCKVEFYDGRTRRQNTCKAESCQRERHRVEEWHFRRMQKQRERRLAKPVVERKQRSGSQFTDEKAEAIWNSKFRAEEKAYYAAKTLPFERKGNCWL
jgi:hypothetical protein